MRWTLTFSVADELSHLSVTFDIHHDLFCIIFRELRSKVYFLFLLSNGNFWVFWHIKAVYVKIELKDTKFETNKHTAKPQEKSKTLIAKRALWAIKLGEPWWMNSRPFIVLLRVKSRSCSPLAVNAESWEFPIYVLKSNVGQFAEDTPWKLESY